MSDRDRLEALARTMEEERQNHQHQLDIAEADEAKSAQREITSDKEITQTIFDYCLREIRGFKLVPTGHSVAVDMSNCSKIHGIQPDGMDYVCLNIQHWGEETNDFQGIIPLIMIRYRHGDYQLIGPTGKQSYLKSFDELRDQLVNMLAAVDRQAILALFAVVRSHFPRGRSSRF